MGHRCSYDGSPVHGVKADSHPLTHAARPVIDKDHYGSVVGERSSRSYHLDPVSLNVWLTVVRDSVPLIWQHRLDESPYNAKCHGAIAPARHVSQIKDKAMCEAELFQDSIEGCNGLLITERIVKSNQTNIPRQN